MNCVDENNNSSNHENNNGDHDKSEAGNRGLLSVEQAANYLQLSPSSIRAYIRQGKLKAFRVAGLRKVLIAREELLKLLEPAREVAMEDDGR